MIKDSGNRTDFGGAVRDIQEGKGRCDLLPLDIVADLTDSKILRNISRFQESGDVNFLAQALGLFAERIDIDPSTMFLETAIHFEEGCQKYGENNWRAGKGIPAYSYINSAVRHYLKWIRGDEDERHDRAFCWNIICCMWTCEHKPENNSYMRKEES